MKKFGKKYLIAIIYTVLLISIITIILKFGVSSPEETEKIGFITTGDLTETGWSTASYKGAKQACDNLGVEMVSYSGIPEYDGTCPAVVKDLADMGVGMIILNSYGYAQEMKEKLSNYPELVFYGASADYSAPNLTAYSSRMYQVRYLSGIVAGMQTKNGKIGFVAANRENSVRRGINAFALGVRRVNPDAEIIVAWTDSWNDKDKETELARALIEKENADIITYHQDTPNVIEVTEKYGVASIGYYEAVKDVSDNYLTCAVCDWTPIFEKMIAEYLRGQGNSVAYDWMGLESGVIYLTEYSPLVSEETKNEVEKAKEEILSGWDVFTGLIYDNQGKERCGEGEAMSDATLLHGMDWLVEGIREYGN